MSGLGHGGDVDASAGRHARVWLRRRPGRRQRDRLGRRPDVDLSNRNREDIRLDGVRAEPTDIGALDAKDIRAERLPVIVRGMLAL
jgi:hypothetical protein